MRGRRRDQASALCLISVDACIPERHPIRRIKPLADEALRALSPLFDKMYAEVGRPSVPPEHLLKATLLMALFSVRSERQFCEQLGFNLLFRWFLDMDLTDRPFDATAFSHNRERLLRHEVATHFFRQVVEQARQRTLLSEEHFSVDGTLIEAWASIKSFRPKDEDDDGDNNGWATFKGEKRSNETHESKTDPEAKLMRKGNGREAKLSYMGHVLMENRNGLILDFRVTEANGRAEREAGLEMAKKRGRKGRRVTLAADKGYDTKDFVAGCHEAGLVPHVAQNQHARRRSAIDGRTTRHPGYARSQVARMLIEKIFGWMKTVGGLRRTRLRGRQKTEAASLAIATAYNLLRMSKLEATA